MKQVFIIGNWKSYKTSLEATQWFNEASTLIAQTPIAQHKTVVLHVPFTLLSQANQELKAKSLPIYIGAQDVSPFTQGAYTGAINAQQIKEFATHVIIGHSERRRYFNETDAVLAEKVKRAQEQGLSVIYLVQSENEPIPQGVTLVGYEPVGAIGTGNPETPENAQLVAQKIKQTYPFVTYVLYGGSVTANNVASFTSLPDINGIVPGGASLTPGGFLSLIQNA
jgi:triosephosphate isomerase